MNTLAKCKCQHCNQKIEFDSSQAGETIPCPNCGMDTLLFIPQADPLSEPPPLKKPPTIKSPLSTKIQKQSSYRSAVDAVSFLIQILVCCMAIGLFITGIALVVGGCQAETDESKRAISSAIRQNVYVVQYCTGFILIGISPIVFASARLMAWFREHAGNASR